MLFGHCVLLLLALLCIFSTIDSLPHQQQAQFLLERIADSRQLADMQTLKRLRRQIDLSISADHDDKDDETELALEAIAGLWRSPSGKTSIEGSAKVVHRTNSMQSGNTNYSARLHLHHDYKK